MRKENEHRSIIVLIKQCKIIMARRNDHTKDEIRKMVILSGLKLIKEYGFSGFSTRQIAKDIGYTVGTLYNVFDSYDDIMLHINAATLDEMKEFIEQNLDKQLKGVDAVKQLAKLYIIFADKNRNSWCALFEYAVPSDVRLPDWFGKKVEDLFMIIASILVDFIDEESDSLKHAKIIWASIHGLCILGLAQKLDIIADYSMELLADSMIETYLKGMK